MSNFVIENGVLKEYKGKEKEVVVPKGVIEIGKLAFLHCTSLTSITLPEGLETIGNDAFSNCHSLSSVNLPNSIKSIDEGAFFDCTSLTSIALPEGLERIGNGAFGFCTNLTSITLPNGIKKIGMGVFSECVSLKKINLPKDFDQGAPWLKKRFKWDLIVVSALECCNKDTKIVKYITKNKKEAIDTLEKAKRTDLVPALLEKSSKIKLEDLNDLIDYAQEYKDAELNALLLDYKNKIYNENFKKTTPE